MDVNRFKALHHLVGEIVCKSCLTATKFDNFDLKNDITNLSCDILKFNLSGVIAIFVSF